MNFNKAVNYAREKHLGQYRKHGENYIVHPLRVVEILREKGIEDEEVLMAGLFHDLLEDTDASEEEILSYGSPRVLELVRLLSKEKAFVMEEYIDRIYRDEDARLIKLADRLSNLEDSFRLRNLKFLERYIKDTEDNFEKMCKETVFEEELRRSLESLKEYVAELKS